MATELPVTLRTAATERRYREAIANGTTLDFDEIPNISEWTYWELKPNDYGADMAMMMSHMLVIKRHGVVSRKDMTAEELAERDYIHENIAYRFYHIIAENVPSRRSKPHRYHEHFWKYYDKREEMSL